MRDVSRLLDCDPLTAGLEIMHMQVSEGRENECDDFVVVGCVSGDVE